MVSRVLIAAALFTMTLVPRYASAFPLPLSTTDELILNWDLSGQSPTPPFSVVDISTTYQNLSFQDLTVTVYGDLNGVDPVQSTTQQSFPLVDLSLLFDGDEPNAGKVLDGVFSVGFLLGAPNDLSLPDPQLTGAVAFGQSSGGTTALIAGTEGTSSVPEPATAILLGMGLMALAVWRRANDASGEGVSGR